VNPFLGPVRWLQGFWRYGIKGQNQLAMSGIDPVTGERWHYEEGEDGPGELTEREREILQRVFPEALEEPPSILRRLVFWLR
jgi:hypothetical protein